MVASVIRYEQLDNSAPNGMLDWQHNCAANAFACVLEIGNHATINLFIAKGWIPSAQALQYDNAIATVATNLPLTKRATDEAWLSLKQRLGQLADGRYFAINTGVNKFGGQGVGHAVAIIVNGNSWSMKANNSEKKEQLYSSALLGSDKFSVWGPA